MKKVIILSLALALVGGVAYANFCARDNVPAATLLVPYIVVDMTAAGQPDASGYTTFLSVTNVSATAQIIHISVFSALSEAAIDFNEIVSGYDVWEMNFRDLLNGDFRPSDTDFTALPAVSPYILDPFEWGPDGRGQGGTYSELATPQNRNLAAIATACPSGSVKPPYGNRSDLSSTIITLVRGSLAAYAHDGCGTIGNLRPGFTRFGEALPASPLFFYATVEVSATCSRFFPNSNDYWGSDFTTLTVLTGQVLYFNGTKNLSEAVPAVAIEANRNVLRSSTMVPFYAAGGSVLPATQTYREPLGTAFAFRYGNDPLIGLSSNAILWKNAHEVNLAATTIKISDCGNYVYYAWDMDERSLSTSTFPISGLPSSGRDPNQFPFETQKVPLTNAYFDLPGAYGWMLIVLPPSYGPFTDPTATPTWFTPVNQYMGWAALQFVWQSGTAAGYSAAVEATTMANAFCYPAPQQQMPNLGTNNGTGALNAYGMIPLP